MRARRTTQFKAFGVGFRRTLSLFSQSKHAIRENACDLAYVVLINAIVRVWTEGHRHAPEGGGV
jgi:hypothetical protein